MTVYVDHAPTGADPGRDLVWARLWADDPAEAADFATRLGVTWPTGQAAVVIAEGSRRRAILMGAIPVATAPTAPAVTRAAVREVAA